MAGEPTTAEPAAWTGIGTTIFAEMSALRRAPPGRSTSARASPTPTGPREIAAGRRRRDPGRARQPVPARARASRSCARRSPRTRQRFYGLDVRPGHRGAGHRRRDRGDRGGPARAGRAGRRGDRVRALLRLLRGLHRAWPGRSGCRSPCARRTSAPTSTRCARAITPRTRLILLNTPHNPTGAVFTRDELAAIAGARRRARPARGHRRGLRAPGVRRRARADRDAARACAERTVTISSAGKTFSFTGWKIGWVTGTPGAGDRGPHGQAVPHLRQRRPVPVRGGRGARAAGRATTPRSARTCGPSATCSATGLAEAGFEVYRPQGTYFVTTDVRPLGVRRRHGVLPRACRSGPAWWPSRAAVFYDDAEAGRSRRSGSRSASSPTCWPRR